MPTTITTATVKDIVVRSKTITLTDEQIKALPSTPIELLPSLDEGPVMLISASLVIDSTNGAYGNVASSEGGITAIYLDRLTMPPFTLISSAFAGNKKGIALVPKTEAYTEADVEVIRTAAGVGEAKITSAFSVVAVPITIRIYNYDATYSDSLGNFTGGHPDNYMKVTIVYTTVDE